MFAHLHVYVKSANYNGFEHCDLRVFDLSICLSRFLSRVKNTLQFDKLKWKCDVPKGDD